MLSSSITVVSDAKPRKVGTLPTYNISFKCEGRAEKRKESMMDVVNNIVVSGNGVHQLPEVVAGIPNGMPHASSSNEELERSLQSTVILIDSETVASSVQKVNDETIITVESNAGVSSEEHEANESDDATNSKEQKTPPRARNTKNSGPKNGVAKKSKDGTEASNGTLASKPRPKQPSSLNAMGKSLVTRKLLSIIQNLHWLI